MMRKLHDNNKNHGGPMKSVFGGLIAFATVLGLSLSVSSTALAQTREEIQRDLLERQLRTETQAVVVDGAIERAPCPLASPEFAELTFVFQAADFSGLDAIDASIVEPVYNQLVGRRLAVSTICDIRDGAATVLRQAGFLAAVQVPVQEIQNGVVRFDVVLARMTSAQVRGDAGHSGLILQKYIDRLVSQPVFNIDQAERYLLLARDIPGLDVRLVMQPAPRETGGQRGDVVGIFNVTRTPWEVDATLQNYGSKAVGRFGGLARVKLNGLTGLADQTTLSVYSTSDPDEQVVLQAGHVMRLGGEGFTLGADATLAWSQPDVVGPDLFESETFIGSIYGAYPFKRSQTSNVIGTVGLDIINQEVEFSGLPLSEDKLRVAYARLDFNAIDEPSISGVDGYSSIEPRLAVAGSLEVRQGIDLFGASDSCGVGFVNCIAPSVVPPSRLDGDPTGLVIRAQGQIDFRPSPDWLISMKPRAQWSPDPLLSFEQVSGGNYTAGRGYDPGAVIGDSGFGGQVELAYGSLVPETPGGSTYQPYVFFDLMSVSTKNVAGDPQTIASAGGGVRARLGSSTYLDITGAAPLKRAPFQTDRGDFRLLMTLSVRFGPGA